MEYGQGGAENGGGDGHPVDGHLRLVEVESSLAVHEERQLTVLDGVVAAPCLVAELQGSLDCAEPITSGGHGVDQAVAGRVFVVVEVADCALTLRAGVDRVDEHVGHRRRPSYLDSGATEVLWHGRDAPFCCVDLRDGRVRGHDAVFQGSTEHLETLGPQVVDSPHEFVVRRDEVFEELRGEYFIGPFDVCVCDSLARFGHVLLRLVGLGIREP